MQQDFVGKIFDFMLERVGPEHRPKQNLKVGGLIGELRVGKFGNRAKDH